MKSNLTNELPFHVDAESFIVELNELHNERKNHKLKSKRKILGRAERLVILQKTDAKCHICGKPLSKDNFQADHVKSHITGGTDSVDNFLPSCNTCNNYRWHYGWEEIQYILKIGVWAKGQIQNETKLGIFMAEGFVKHEKGREKRRSKPRQ